MNYQIGYFSKITSLSIKTLRFYHEKGLLEPSYIDAETGYRFYDEHLIYRANAIRMLKAFDFSIKEIKEILNLSEDDSDITRHLKHKADEIKTKIQRFQTMERDIQEVLRREEKIQMINVTQQVKEIEVEDILIASLRVKALYSDCGQYFGELFKHCGRHRSGTIFNLYWDAEYVEGEADIEICLPVKKVVKKQNVSSRILEGGRALSIVYKGPYGGQGKAYEFLFNEMNQKEYQIIQPPREIYHKGPGMIFKGNPNKYLTEIQLLVN